VVSLDTAFLVVVLLLDFAISLWNAYASGVTLTLLRGQPGQRFAKAAGVSGLGLAFAGMAYATIIVLAWVGLLVGFLLVGDFLFLVSFDFLVFAAMIIGFGLVVTAQSVAIAYRQRSFGAIGIAAWNVFTEIWDISIYAEGFRNAASVVSSGRNKINLYAILAAAVGVSFIITYVAYRHGVRRAEASIEASPGQPASPDGPYDARYAHKAHPLRTVVIAAVVTVVVVVALIVASPYVTVSNQVKVTEIDVWAPGDVCGLGSHPAYYAGFNDVVGSSDAFHLQILNFNATACTLRGVTTNTSGFGLANVAVPLTVAGSGNGTLNLTVILPNSAFHGILNLVYT
jgi:hypothetical protein